MGRRPCHPDGWFSFQHQETLPSLRCCPREACVRPRPQACRQTNVLSSDPNMISPLTNDLRRECVSITPALTGAYLGLDQSLGRNFRRPRATARGAVAGSNEQRSLGLPPPDPFSLISRSYLAQLSPRRYSAAGQPQRSSSGMASSSWLGLGLG